MNYDGKFGTKDPQDKDSLNDMLANSSIAGLTDAEEELEMPVLNVDLNEVNKEAKRQAKIITERLSNYFFDPKYIQKHPYIPSKIATEMDNIRRLLKMLAINEKAQDTLITSITSNIGKGTLYGSLTSLQNSMLSIQSQLNTLTDNIEKIFQEMQANCEETFEEKDKEERADGSMVVRGSRDFIKDIDRMLNGDITNDDSSAMEITLPVE